jgi:hypothetical protein
MMVDVNSITIRSAGMLIQQTGFIHMSYKEPMLIDECGLVFNVGRI